MRLLRQPWPAPRRDEPVGVIQVHRELQHRAEEALQVRVRVPHPDLYLHHRRRRTDGLVA